MILDVLVSFVTRILLSSFLSWFTYRDQQIFIIWILANENLKINYDRELITNKINSRDLITKKTSVGMKLQIEANYKDGKKFHPFLNKMDNFIRKQKTADWDV